MKNMFLFICFLLFFSQCGSKSTAANQQNDEEPVYIGDSINYKIQIENEKAWEEATKVRESITDSTFLQTKRPMSDDAIAPYNYKTGVVEDRAYNRVVYIKAFERAKKHLLVVNGAFVCDLKNGADINISEDLYRYIMDIFSEWNLGLQKGKYKITKSETGGYDILPISAK